MGRTPKTDDERRFNQALGRSIRAARITAGLSQAQVAAAAGVSRPNVTQMESGANGCRGYALALVLLATVGRERAGRVIVSAAIEAKGATNAGV